ncbi:hypothetical protein D3C78_1728930 [compost metagenome]
MTGAVAKMVAVSILGDNVARKRVGFHTRHSRLDMVQRMKLRFQHDVVNFKMLVAWLTNNYRTSYIGTIALVIGAKIKLNKFVVANNAIAGYAMRQRGAFA